MTGLFFTKQWDLQRGNTAGVKDKASSANTPTIHWLEINKTNCLY